MFETVKSLIGETRTPAVLRVEFVRERHFPDFTRVTASYGIQTPNTRNAKSATPLSPVFPPSPPPVLFYPPRFLSLLRDPFELVFVPNSHLSGLRVLTSVVESRPSCP